MRGENKIGSSTISDCNSGKINRQRYSRLILAAAGVAAGMLSFSSPVAKANVPLFTTADDFALDSGDGNNNGWTVQSSSAVAPSTAYDSDGTTTNGVGNTTNAGGTGVAGSFQITPSGNISYNTLAQAPGSDQSDQAFFTALDPGSIAAYTAGSGYGQGTTTDYSGTLEYTYTVPVGTVTAGNYLQAGIVMNGLPQGYQRYFANNTISDGIVNGQPTYTATIPYTITAGNFGYFQFGIVFNTNYTFNAPFYVDNLQVVTASAAGQAEWIVNGNGSWTVDANWNPGAPLSSGSSALFDSDGGAITTNPTVTLTAPVTIDSLNFNTAAVNYTINGSTGSITTLAINVMAGSHTLNTNLVSKDQETFTISPGASLTATNSTDGVGYYHNVFVTGGGTLSANNFNNAALQINGGTTFTLLAGSGTTTGVYGSLQGASTLNLNSPIVLEQIYTDNASTINIGPGGSLLTEAQTASIDAFVAGTGSIFFGGGPNGSGNPGSAALTNTNSNYSGPITVSNGDVLTIGSQYFASADANLGNASATNTVTLNNGTLAAVNSFTGSHAFIIGSGGGTFSTANTVNGNAVVSNIGVGSVSGPGTLNITGGGVVNVGAQVLAANASGGIRALSLGALSINTSTLTLSSAASQKNRTLLQVGSLSLSGATGAWTSLLDLGGNDLDIQSGSLSDVLNQLKQGSSTGTVGIISSLAAADTTHTTTLGAIQNLPGFFTKFDGQTVGSGDILVKYTYYGDANLSGVVDGSDYSLIDNGYNRHLTGWLNGDFNNDGVVDGSDYSLIDNSYLSHGASLATLFASPNAEVTAQVAGSGASSAVPEPASLSLIGISAASLLGRRRRANSR